MHVSDAEFKLITTTTHIVGWTQLTIKSVSKFNALASVG